MLVQLLLSSQICRSSRKSCWTSRPIPSQPKRTFKGSNLDDLEYVWVVWDQIWMNLGYVWVVWASLASLASLASFEFLRFDHFRVRSWPRTSSSLGRLACHDDSARGDFGGGFRVTGKIKGLEGGAFFPQRSCHSWVSRMRLSFRVFFCFVLVLSRMRFSKC